ncbi:MAG TPA: hypothetical protein VMF52_18520 [Steroidobacteraceae bacterium]|nr:hypothetical protein [Steroidobacteraceae bacterium]
MSSRVLTRVLLLAALVAAPLHARDVDLGTLRAWELPGYTLIALDGDDPTRIARRIADTERVLGKLLARQVKPTTTPMTVWLAPEDLWNRYLAPGPAIAGEYVPRRFSNYLILNGDLAPSLMGRGLQHECTHWFLNTQVGGIFPLWFDEGMAELLGRSRIRKRQVTFDVPPAPPAGGWVEMARLFELDKRSPEYLEPPNSEMVHLESWALVHRGLIADTTFGDRIFAYLSAINRLVPTEDAMPKSFGTSYAELDTLMRSYLVQPRMTLATLPLDEPAPTRLPAGRLLGDAEALATFARVALDTGFRPEYAHELVDAAAAAAPGARAVAALKLRLAVRNRDDAEALRLGAELPATPDAAAARDIGLALFERVNEPERALPDATRERFETLAFAALERALDADPGDPPAAWGYAMLATRRQSHVAQALDRLAAARQRMPGHPDLSEATARALEATGKEDAMMPFLVDALRNTSSSEQRAWAARRIRELRLKQREQAPQ